jgi:hypothetical protein
MPDSFHSRLPSLPQAELRRYVEHPQDYRSDAVEAALAELERRGVEVGHEERARIRVELQRRDAALHGRDSWFARFLGPDAPARARRIREVTGGILASGLGAAGIIYLTARPKGPNPLGYEPEDTKRYLRDLELYGGKANLIATEFRRWFESLWQGRNLAWTLATLTLVAALVFWWLASRKARELEVAIGEGP